MTPDPSEVCSSLTTILAGRPLPIIRRTAAQVMALLSNPNSKVDTIADAILHDQAFTTRLLKVANSAHYQRDSGKITGITQAVARTGYNTVRDIAVASEFAELVQKRLPTAVNLRRLLAKVFVAAHQAVALAEAARMTDVQILFTHALLEGLGDFAMAAYLPKVFLTVEESVLATGLPYEEAHLQATGA